MRPRFSFSRGEDLEPPAETGDAELDDANERAFETGGPDSAPIRPDLGPPAPGPQSGNQPGSGLGLIISVAVAAVVFVLAIYATGSPTTNPLPLAQTTNALFWLVGVVVTVAAGLGAVYADRTAFRGTQFEDQQVAPDFTTAWIIPAVATTAALLLVATYHNTMMIVAGPLIAFVGNAGSLLSRDLLDDADDTALKTATTIHTLVVHTIAFLALSAIYLNKLPTVVVALLALVVTALLVLESLERRQVLASRKVLLALLAGSAVAAVATPLMWWLTHGWTGGAVLFVAFYIAVGVISAVVTNGTLRMRDAVEYGMVSLVAFVILAVTA
ncbi:MAG: hypothetical protein M3Z20_14475 [Chloroflexota bacterium]|nr:hypothetical protein [Chloroflexota bacterium]